MVVPDSRGLDQNFHDVTIVDMDDVPEPLVSLQELSLLRQQWPPAVLSHMVWLQQDLEVMRAEAKQRFRQTQTCSLSSCIWSGNINIAVGYMMRIDILGAFLMMGPFICLIGWIISLEWVMCLV